MLITNFGWSNRPKALNALCSPLMAELRTVLDEFDSDQTVGAVVITGSERAFAGWSLQLHKLPHAASLISAI